MAKRPKYPYQPIGINSLAPTASVTGTSNKRLVSKSPINATAVARIAMTAKPLITIMTFNASPAPAK